MLSKIQSASIVLALTLAASSSYAASLSNNTSVIEPVDFASVMTGSATPVSSNADIGNVPGASNVFWVFGGSLVGLSLVTRRLSV